MEENEKGYAYFPLFMRMEGAHVLVFGAGQIAARRVGALVKTACRLTVVAPECGDKMRALLDTYGARIVYVQDVYRSGCLADEDMDFVLAATDDAAVNEAIYRECRHREIYVNVASNRRLCSFYFPATVEHEGLVVASASAEASEDTHAGVKELRRRVERALGQGGDAEKSDGSDRNEKLSEISDEIKEEIKDEIEKPGQRERKQ